MAKAPRFAAVGALVDAVGRAYPHIVRLYRVERRAPVSPVGGLGVGHVDATDALPGFSAIARPERATHIHARDDDLRILGMNRAAEHISEHTLADGFPVIIEHLGERLRHCASLAARPHERQSTTHKARGRVKAFAARNPWPCICREQFPRGCFHEFNSSQGYRSSP